MSSIPLSNSLPTPEQPLVAATWQERTAEAPWCPPELAAHLGPTLAWVASVAAEDARAEAHDDAASGWRVVAATRRGRVHAHAGAHREDAYAVARTVGGVLVAIASDGAGSAPWSRVGAEVTCREAARAAAAALDNAPPPGSGGASDVALGTALGAALTGALRAVCTALRDLAERSGASPKDFRCTALAVALDPRSGLLAAVQVGDGAVAVRTRDGAVRVLGAPDSGEYSGEVSCFVPDACADGRAEAVTVVSLADVADVLVATDGVEDALYPLARTGPAAFAQLRHGVGDPLEGFQRQPAHGPVLGGGVSAADAAERLGAWLTFEKRGENDDRTVVLLSRLDA